MGISRRNMKAILLTVVLGCLTALPAVAAPVFGLLVSRTGTVEQVQVTASGLTDLYAYQFTLNFDPTVLQATSVTEGGFLLTGGATFFDPGTTDNTGGTVSFVFDTLLGPGPGVTGSGLLATIDLTNLQLHKQTTLSLTDVIALDSNLNEIPVLTTSAQIPEPGMLALFAIGLVALGMRAKRQTRA
jgi:hypothetical protein